MASATTALIPIHPRCTARVASAFAIAAKPNTTASVAMIQCRAASDCIQGAAISSTPPAIQATVPACQTSRNSVRSRGGSTVPRANTLVSPSTPWAMLTRIAITPAACNKRSRIGTSFASIQYCMEYREALAPVNTVVYGTGITRRRTMADQLSAQDWVDLGLRTLARSGFTALKAEPLARAMGVSRGSFYWHFADIGAFHAAILIRWREVATEQIIAAVETAKNNKGDDPLAVLLKLTFGSKLVLEKAVRSWAANDTRARAAVIAVDRRRLDYIENLLKQAGLAEDVARARAQILFWTFFGYALSDQAVPPDKQQAVLEDLLRIVSR